MVQGGLSLHEGSSAPRSAARATWATTARSVRSGGQARRPDRDRPRSARRRPQQREHLARHAANGCLYDAARMDEIAPRTLPRGSFWWEAEQAELQRRALGKSGVSGVDSAETSRGSAQRAPRRFYSARHLTPPPVPPAAGSKTKFRDSAVVVLVRGQGASLEAFWVQRSDAVPVQTGFHAFAVGGKVDAADTLLPLDGADHELERAARARAIREALEETACSWRSRRGRRRDARRRAREQLLAGTRPRCPNGRTPRLALRRVAADVRGPLGDRWRSRPCASTCCSSSRACPRGRRRAAPGELARRVDRAR